jgi:hypothetical protein
MPNAMTRPSDYSDTTEHDGWQCAGQANGLTHWSERNSRQYVINDIELFVRSPSSSYPQAIFNSSMMGHYLLLNSHCISKRPTIWSILVPPQWQLHHQLAPGSATFPAPAIGCHRCAHFLGSTRASPLIYRHLLQGGMHGGVLGNPGSHRFQREDGVNRSQGANRPMGA